MTENNDIISLTLEMDVDKAVGDTEYAVQKVHTLTAAVEKMQTALSHEAAENELIPGFADDMRYQYESAKRSANALLGTIRKINDANETAFRDQHMADFKRELEYMKTFVADLTETTQAYRNLVREVGSDNKKFTLAFARNSSDIYRGLQANARGLAMGGLSSDEQLINVLKNLPMFKNSENADVFTDSRTSNMLRALIGSSVAQYNRTKYSNINSQTDHSSWSVKDLVPERFKNVEFSIKPTVKDAQTNAEAKAQRGAFLNDAEKNLIKRVIMTNGYLMPEAEHAQLIKMRNGKAYFNENASQFNVNAFAGLIASSFTRGLIGRYSNKISEIKDPNDPTKTISRLNDIQDANVIQKMASRSNLLVNNAREAMELLDRLEWLNPEYYGNIPNAIRQDSQFTILSGAQRKPRIRTMEFPEYEFGARFDAGATFDEKSHGYVPINHGIRHTRLYDSRYNPNRFEHNGVGYDEIYIKLPIEELSDPNTSDERKKEIREQLSQYWNGVRVNGTDYEIAGSSAFTKTHLILTKKSLAEKIKADDQYFFNNGQGLDRFHDYTAFGAAMDAGIKLNTEGESIETLQGVDMSKAKVVVVDWKKFGLDGENIANSRYFTQGFQGRTADGSKATYGVWDLQGLKQYYNDGNGPIHFKEDGTMVIRGGGVNGEDAIIAPDTHIIEDVSNIKNPQQYQVLDDKGKFIKWKSQDEINRERTETYRQGLIAKTTYDAAETRAKYIPAQIAATLNFDEPSEEMKKTLDKYGYSSAIDYFNDIYHSRMAMLNNEEDVVKLLFSGNDLLSRKVQADRNYLATDEAQKRIEDEMRALERSRAKGDLLLPLDAESGHANYAMLSAWIPDVLNKIITENGGTLTTNQRRLSLGNAEAEAVMYLASQAQQLGVERNPGTAGGNVLANNKGVEKFFRDASKMFGVDSNALYLNPAGTIKELMQSADFDGDTAIVHALKHNTAFGDIMIKLFESTKQRYEEKIKPYTDDKAISARKQTVETPDGKTYSIDNIDDVFEYYKKLGESAIGMGGANAVAVGAWQHKLSADTARALAASEGHYDALSVLAKKGTTWNTMQAEFAVLNEGGPFSNLSLWANKSWVDYDPSSNKPYIAVRGKTAFDMDKFSSRNVDRINFTSVNQGKDMFVLADNYLRHQMKGVDVTGDTDYSAIFEALPTEFAEGTKAHELVKRLRKLREQRLTGEQFGFEDELAAELSYLAIETENELARNVVHDPQYKDTSEQLRALEQAKKDAGVYVVANLLRFGATRTNIEHNPALKQMVEEIERKTGKSAFQAAESNVVFTELPKLLDLNALNNQKKLNEEKQQKLQETQQELDVAEAAEEEKGKKLASLIESKLRAPMQDPDESSDHVSYRREEQQRDLAAEQEMESLIKQIDDEIDNISSPLSERYEIDERERNKRIEELSGYKNDLSSQLSALRKSKNDAASNRQAFADTQDESGTIEKLLSVVDLMTKENNASVVHKRMMAQSAYDHMMDQVGMTKYNLYETIDRSPVEISKEKNPYHAIYKRYQNEAEHRQNSISEILKLFGGIDGGLDLDQVKHLEEERDNLPLLAIRAFAHKTLSDARKTSDRTSNTLSNLRGDKDVIPKALTSLDEDALYYEKASAELAHLIEANSSNSQLKMELTQIKAIIDDIISSTKDARKEMTVLLAADDADNIQRMADMATGNYSSNTEQRKKIAETIQKHEAMRNDLETRDQSKEAAESRKRIDDWTARRNKLAADYGDLDDLDKQLKADRARLDKLNERRDGAQLIMQELDVDPEDEIERLAKSIAQKEAVRKEMFDYDDAIKSENSKLERYSTNDNRKEIERLDTIIAQEKKNLEIIHQSTQQQTHQKYDYQIDSLSRSLDSNDPISRLRTQSEDYHKRISEIRTSLAQEFKLGNISESDYNALMQRLKELESGITPVKLGWKQFADVVNRSIGQFGRQMFHKAINETKQFVATYDAAMTEIQMVTLKTDEEIATLGDGLIDKAIDLKVSVGDVTTAATALYRQGLSDAQVDDRLEDVTKFAKTAKVKTDDAIKLITVAMNSEMVKSSDQAMDVISALSDSAATEAAQITKGLQKSMSAAKEVGVTYKELVAMLTVITSKTQLSGSVAGTTMRNLLSRLVRVNQDDLIVDESGVAISASQQARVLNSLGLQIYNRADGSIDAYNTLSQVGSMWNDLSDAERNQVAFVLGGSEQFSNVAALMQGFAETDENGQNLLQKYLSIAEGSTGITDEKYAHYLDSLAASMDGFTSSFDAMIKSATDSAPVVAFFNFLTDSVSGLTALNEELNAVPSTLVLIGGAIAAIMAMAQPFKIAFGVIAGIAALGSGLNYIREANPQTTAMQRLTDASKALTSNRNSTRSLHEEAKKLNEQRNERDLSADELVDLKQMLFELESLGHISLDAGESIDSLATSAEETSVALLHAAQSIEQYDAAQASRLIHDAAKSIDQDFASQREDNVGWERETLTQDDIDVINQHTGGDPSKLVGWSISGLGLSPDNSLFDAVRNLYAAAENSGFLDNQLTVYEEQTEGGFLGLGGDTVRTAIPWRELSEDEKNLRLQRNDVDLFDAILRYANTPRAAANMNTPSVSFGSEQEQKLRSVLTASTLPGLASDKMLELLIVEVIKAINEGLNVDPENFSVDQWIHENLSDEYGQVSEDVTRTWLQGRNPQATEAAIALSTPFGRLASIADNATLMNKAGADMISPELYKMMLSAKGATYAEKMNSLATAFMEKEYAEAYLQNKDNADVAAVFKNAAAIDKDGKLTGEVSASFGEEEWFTLMQLLSSKTSQLAMAGYRSDVAQRNAAYASLESILNAESPLESYQHLSDDEATNKRLQDELGKYIDEELLNILLSGNATDEIKAYAKRQIKYGDNISDTFKDRAYYDTALSQLLGAGYEDGLTTAEWSTVPQQYAELLKSPMGSQFLTDILQLDGGVDMLMELAEALENGEVNGEKLAEALKHIVDQMNADDLAKMTKYKKNAAEIAKIQSDIAKGGKDAATAVLDINNKVKDFNNIKWAVDQFKGGNRSSKVVDTIAEYFGGDLNAKELKKTFGDQAESYVDLFEASLRDAEVQLVDEIDQGTNDLFAKANAEMLSTTGQDIFNIGNIKIGGVVDISALANAMAGATGDWSQIFLANIKQMAEAGATLTSKVDEETGKIILGWDLSGVDIGSGYRGSYSGGGGAKKSSADKLVERLGYGNDLYEHQIKMVQYEQTKYENADELGNYGKMLEEELEIERAYLPVLESNIAALRSELGNVKEGSEDWYKLRDAILEAEEQFADINNTIEENEKKLEENHQAILKLHTDLEEMVVGEIELRIDAEKEMLDGAVSMQDIVLNAIKQRYQDEWDLIKQDIEKKKEALQQEKDLIDERLDARRDAEDEAAKYEELAELKKQLSLISMDSTRTKDAAALRESIAELEKEIGWDIAEKEAENEKNAIQDQIDAYDDYVTKGDEDLDELLSDANNFAEEVNGVMKLNQTELFDWLKQNVKEYSQSLDDAQKQMVQSWEATYKQMLGITDTYWDEVNAILSSKDVFLEYMKQSNEYIYASEDERAQLLYQWEEAYDKWRKAQKNDADYSHGDSGLGDYSGSEYTGSSSGGSSGGGSGSDPKKEQSTTDSINANVGSGAPFTIFNDDGYCYGSTDSKSDAVSVAQSASKKTGISTYITDKNGKIVGRYDANGTVAEGPSSSYVGDGRWMYTIRVDGDEKETKKGYKTRELAQKAAAARIAEAFPKGKYTTKYFKHGGIADFTGPAWLDGTPEEPERILSADQTRDFETLVDIMSDFRNAGVPMDALRGMARWSSMISVPSSLSHIGSAAYQGNSANIGDIFVNITEAQISDDRDIEVLANIVGEKFVKEIGKQGFNVSRYNF